MATARRREAAVSRTHPVERVVFFTDAVVAIAMTLLILPLMESVSDAPEQGDTLAWMASHGSQLLSFGLSFVLIAVFWRCHRRLYETLVAGSGWMFVLNFCWMFTIVWLPVATALTGAMPIFDPVTGAPDRILIAVYVGTLCVNALLLYLMEREANRHPALWQPGAQRTRVGESVALAMTILFALAAGIAMILPHLNLLSMLLLVLTRPLQATLSRRMAALPGRTR